MKVFLLFFFLLLTIISFASEDSDQAIAFEVLDKGFDFDAEKQMLLTQGYPEAPILKCPKPDKKYQVLLEQLGAMKAKIASEACPKEKVEEFNDDKKNLLSLAQGPGFKLLSSLFKKGTGSSQLSVRDVIRLQSYVDDVIRKTASLTGIVNNPACFEEHDKIDNLSTLAGIVGKISGIVGTFAGPYGVKINLVGRLSETLLKSFGEIVKARRTYNYSLPEDQKNFLFNLCTYYQLKPDLDIETSYSQEIVRYRYLSDVTQIFLDTAAASCSDCAFIISDYMSGQGQENAYTVERRLSFERGGDFTQSQRMIGLELGGGSVGSASSMEESRTKLVTKSQKNIYDEQLIDHYMKAVTQRHQGRSKGETGGTGIENFSAGSSSMTVRQRDTRSGRLEFADMIQRTIRALRIFSWVNEEIESLAEGDLNGLHEGGRLALIKEQKSIENFLIEHEAPRFIQHFVTELNQSFAKITKQSRKFKHSGSTSSGYRRKFYLDSEFNYQSSQSDEAVLFHEVFRENYDVVLPHNLPVEFHAAYQEPILETWQERVLDMRAELYTLLEPVRVAYGVVVYHCRFYEKSSFRYSRRSKIRKACLGARKNIAHVTVFFEDLTRTSFAKTSRHEITSVLEKGVPENYTYDWLGSTTGLIEAHLEEMGVEKPN